jgi:hypothetical protein
MRHPGENLIRSEWFVEKIPHGEAVAVIRAWHYSLSAPNTGQTFGLYRCVTDGLPPLMGALWLPPTRRAAEAVAGGEWAGVLALSRLAVAPETPRNAASFLLSNSMRQLDRARWPVLLTYADTRHGHTGAIYKATGWRLDATTTAGSYFVKDGRQVGRKRGRRNLSAAQLRADGYVEIREPKLRFVHRLPPRAFATGEGSFVSRETE